MKFEEAKKLGIISANYVHKDNTIILVDDKNQGIFHNNGDSTVSGLAIELLYSNKSKKANKPK